MSFLDVLKTGKIPSIDDNDKLTAYDKYQKSKQLKTMEDTKSVTVISPKDFEDIKTMIDKLKEGLSLVVDFADIEAGLAQRMLDFLCGSVYALDGKVDRIKEKTYIMTSPNIQIINKL